MVIDKAKAVVDACRDGPSDFRELSREVDTLQITILRMKQDYQDPTSLLARKGRSREKDMKQITDNCREVLDEIQTFVDKHGLVAEPATPRRPIHEIKRTWHAYKVGSADLDDVRGKLTFHTSTIDLFLDSLGLAALGRIEHQLSFLVTHWRPIFAQYMASTTAIPEDAKSVLNLASSTPNEDAWDALRSELVAAGISSSDIEYHKERILAYIKGLITNTLSELEIASRFRASSSSAMSSPPNTNDQRNMALTYLNLFAMRDQRIGQEPINFSIATLQYGVYASQPACLIVMDVSYQSTTTDKLWRGELLCSLRTSRNRLILARQ